MNHEPTPTLTLVELLDELAAWVTLPHAPEPQAAAVYATRLRAASERLRMEIAVWREVEPGMVYTGEVVNRCLTRINGDPLPDETPR